MMGNCLGGRCPQDSRIYEHLHNEKPTTGKDCGFSIGCPLAKHDRLNSNEAQRSASYSTT